MKDLEKYAEIQKVYVNSSKEALAQNSLMEQMSELLADFYEKPEYGTFDKIKKTIDQIDKSIKATVKSALAENGIRSSEGPAGKFVYVQVPRVSYDERAGEMDPRVEKILKLKKEVADLEEDVKNDIVLFGKNVKGAFYQNTDQVRFYAAKDLVKDKEIDAKTVDGEILEESK